MADPLDAFVTMQQPISYDWTVRAGDNAVLGFQLAVDGVSPDITGATGLCQIRASYAPAGTGNPVIATATVTLPDPTASKVSVALAAADTRLIAAAIPQGTPDTQQIVQVGVYDVQLDDGTNVVTVLSGTVSVSREVSVP